MTIHGGIAEFERSLIRSPAARRHRRAAKAKGTKFGRPQALDASQEAKDRPIELRRD